MGSLGDSFPERFRVEHSYRALAVGSVIRCEVPDTIKNGQLKPKIKIWIVVGVAEEQALLATIYVNTEIIGFIRSNPRLMNGQYKLKADERGLFDHDCYADCTQLKIKEIETMQELLADNPGFVRGELSQYELAEITLRIQNATTVSKIDKIRFGIS